MTPFDSDDQRKIGPPERGAEESSRWFVYIAVGISLVAMVVGLVFMGWLVFRLVGAL